MAEEIEQIIEEVIKAKDKKTTKRLKELEEHELVYDSSSETLEPVYFWIVDFMNNICPDGVEKIVDNFASSPGGGHYAEIGARAARMQDEAMKMLGTVNAVIKSIINIIYDLKEFEIRLKHYETSHSENKEDREAGMLALKQIWLDNVDIKRGQGSIHAMSAGNLNFVTLRDAFMKADSLKQIDELDLNDRVKRILKPRFSEFLEWKERSEKEIKKRFEIERTYLKSQVNTLQMYTRWAKPYMKAAFELEQKEYGRKPDLVKAFNTMYMELTLLGKKKFDIQQAVIDKDIADKFKWKELKRKYYSCVLISFKFRGIPRKVGQHYVFGGKVTVNFKAYMLNEDELALLEQKLKESDMNDALKLIEATTTESLGQLKEDIDKYLEQEEGGIEIKPEAEDVNPFSALFSFLKRKKPEKTTENGVEREFDLKDIKKDNFIESVVRELGARTAEENCFKIFDTYKKAHAMPSHPDPFEYWAGPRKS